MKRRLYYICAILLIYNVQVVYARNTNRVGSLMHPSKYDIRGTELKDSVVKKKLLVIAENDELFTTHLTFFNGGNIIFDYPVSRSFYLGLGTEFSYCHYHFDNGWNLYDLNFWPIYVDSKWDFLRKKSMDFFVDLSSGISSAYYTKENPLTTKSYQISERGIYIFSGIGYTFKMYKFVQPVIEVGIKGFHISFNKYDVNPHGLTTRVGFIFKNII